MPMARERPAHNAIDWASASPMAEKEKASQGRPGGQHFVTFCMQEESARGRQRN